MEMIIKCMKILFYNWICIEICKDIESGGI